MEVQLSNEIDAKLRRIIDLVDGEDDLQHHLWHWDDHTDYWLTATGMIKYMHRAPSTIWDGEHVLVFTDDSVAILELDIAKKLISGVQWPELAKQ